MYKTVAPLLFFCAGLIMLLTGCAGMGHGESGLFPVVSIEDPSFVSEGTMVQDWYLSPYQMLGPYADAIGSTIDAVIEKGPDGLPAVRLTATLVQRGWGIPWTLPGPMASISSPKSPVISGWRSDRSWRLEPAVLFSIRPEGRRTLDRNPYRFDYTQINEFIRYCRAVGAEPVMIVPVYGNNLDGGPATAQGAADLVTYINGTKKYGVTYWRIGDEVDIYNIYFKGKGGYPVATADQYAFLYNSFARAMLAANEQVHSGIDIKFVGPELGTRYNTGNDWLSVMLDKCKDYIDVVSIHLYGYSAREFTAEAALRDIDRFSDVVRDVKARVARHARPGTPLAITQANLCYDADAGLYTPESREVGPGTFYAALWDADHLGAALEERLWSYAIYGLAEPVQRPDGYILASIWTDPSKNPPT